MAGIVGLSISAMQSWASYSFKHLIYQLSKLSTETRIFLKGQTTIKKEWKIFSKI